MVSSTFCVAIVDDDASVRKALSRLLRAYALNTETYGSGREFLNSLSEGQPECLVLDQHMPEISGLEVQTCLRRAGRNIPTIVITGHDQPGLQEKCESAGAIAYMLKPLNEAELLAAVDKAAEVQSKEKAGGR